MNKKKRNANIMVADIVATVLAHGLCHVVLSPGSRNAPLILAFNQVKSIKTYVIPDERSAAFYALGMSVFLQQPVGLVCTSGTAMLNYSPAIAEAFYQQIPLVVITADRPVEFIDQREGQSIQQYGALSHFVKGSWQMPQEPQGNDDLWYGRRCVNEAMLSCVSSPKGPVHLNVPFKEPLYDWNEVVSATGVIQQDEVVMTLSDKTWNNIVGEWNNTSRKMVLVGQCNDDNLSDCMERIARDSDVVVLTERTSNVNKWRVCDCIDRLLVAVEKDRLPFLPQLLITVGRDVVSKKVKSFLRNVPGLRHWHIEPGVRVVDTYQKLSRMIAVKPDYFFNRLLAQIDRSVHSDEFGERWRKMDDRVERWQNDYLLHMPWCDMKAFEIILKSLRDGGLVHLGNSTPVRYAQLFKPVKSLHWYANRGVSGIDGSVSTAAGMAMVTDKPVYAIVGDMSFLYDSNALWNEKLPANLIIILVNNGGGGIFKFIPGPDTTPYLDSCFSTRNNISARYLCEMFDIKYYRAINEKELQNTLEEVDLFGDCVRLVEVDTKVVDNANVLRKYFKDIQYDN